MELQLYIDSIRLVATLMPMSVFEMLDLDQSPTGDKDHVHSRILKDRTVRAVRNHLQADM